MLRIIINAIIVTTVATTDLANSQLEILQRKFYTLHCNDVPCSTSVTHLHNNRWITESS
jgi:hypothetical protein